MECYQIQRNELDMIKAMILKTLKVMAMDLEQILIPTKCFRPFLAEEAVQACMVRLLVLVEVILVEAVPFFNSAKFLETIIIGLYLALPENKQQIVISRKIMDYTLLCFQKLVKEYGLLMIENIFPVFKYRRGNMLT